MEMEKFSALVLILIAIFLIPKSQSQEVQSHFLSQWQGCTGSKTKCLGKSLSPITGGTITIRTRRQAVFKGQLGTYPASRWASIVRPWSIKRQIPVPNYTFMTLNIAAAVTTEIWILSISKLAKFYLYSGWTTKCLWNWAGVKASCGVEQWRQNLKEILCWLPPLCYCAAHYRSRAINPKSKQFLYFQVHSQGNELEKHVFTRTDRRHRWGHAAFKGTKERGNRVPHVFAHFGRRFKDLVEHTKTKGIDKQRSLASNWKWE